MKALIAEDDPGIMALERILLKKENFTTIDIAHNGCEALSYARENNYDIILLDMMMPLMNGDEFYQALEKESSEKAKRIVVVTASQPYVAKFKEANIPVLSKPFDINELREYIKRIIS